MKIPENLQRAMAAEAEAARNARAQVIGAEGELQASKALREAAAVVGSSPAALQVLDISNAFDLTPAHSYGTYNA